MKKLLFALGLLALVILLTPMQEARAVDIPLCPGCEKPGRVGHNDNPYAHYWYCATNYCEFYERPYRSGWCSGGTATCTDKAVCEVCGEEYGDPLGHDWKADDNITWTWSADHGYSAPKLFYECQRQGCTEPLKTVNMNCSSETTPATCTADGKTVLTGYLSAEESLDHQAHSDQRTNTIKALGHDIVHHDAKAATCTEVGWEAYDACSRGDYTTYEEIPALGHDLIHHKAKAATCTAAGWEAYDTCSRCEYTTYKEIPALGHDLTHHKAKAATCTSAGWAEYDACSRCDHTTYKKIPALGHTEVIDPAVAATCTGRGLTEGKHCGVCGAVITAQKTTPATGHRYRAWQPNDRGKHAAACSICGRKSEVDCTLIDVPGTDPDGTPIRLCPVCGYVEDGKDLTSVEGGKATGAVPGGRLRVFVSAKTEKTSLLTVAIESNGRLVQPKGKVTLALKTETVKGYDLKLIGQDGKETRLKVKNDGGKTSFTLDFMPDRQPVPALILKLIPKK